MKTTVNDISNITFIELRYACWTELLSVEAASLTLHDGDCLELH